MRHKVKLNAMCFAAVIATSIHSVYGDVEAEITTTYKVVAITLYSELNSSKCTHEHAAILAVIRNRAKQNVQLLATTCFKRKQFSYWNKYWKGKWFTVNAKDMLAEYDKIPMSFKRSLAQKMFSSGAFGNVNHFYSPESMKPKGRVPSWAKGKKPAFVTEHFKFYSL